jgi:hypothetical protein
MTNDYNIVRNTKYAVNATIKGTSVTDQRISVRTLSNCYVLAPGQTVYIPVNRANQTAELGIQIPDVTSTTLQPYTYWQSVPNLVATQMDYPSGCLKVTASPTASTVSGIVGGNAVVGVTYGTGTAPAALWSWHIWVTGYDPNSTNLNQNSTVWMDRNLGALEACNGTNTFDRCGGLYYQWGRKDPIPGVNSSGGETTNYYNGSMTGTTGLYAIVSVDATGAGAPNYNLPLAVQNPTTYYSADVQREVQDWYAQIEGIHNDNLWGSFKTVYDPCPVGWKVPSRGAWTSVSWTLFSSLTSNLNYGKWNNNSISLYYPLLGTQIGASILRCGESGFYWTSTSTYTSSKDWYMTSAFIWIEAGSGFSDESEGVPRNQGISVRCVKE